MSNGQVKVHNNSVQKLFALKPVHARSVALERFREHVGILRNVLDDVR